MKSDKLEEVSGGFRSKTINRIIRYINRGRVLPIRPGWEQTPDGIVPPPYIEGGATATVVPWSLSIVDSDAGTLTVSHGTILSHLDKHNDKLTSTNTEAEEYTAASGGFLCIKIQEVAPTEYSIVYESSWPITDDYYVETETVDSEEVFSYRLYPLWYFQATSTDADDLGISDFFATRLAPPAHFKVIHTLYDTESAGSMVSPELIPYHKCPTIS